MAAEMAEQPAVLAGLMGRRDELCGRVRTAVPPELAGISLVARGSSDHAAVYGRYVLEMAARRPAGLAAPSVLSLHAATVDYRGYLAVAVSQSGRTPEVVDVLAAMRERGASTIAIVNGSGSPLADVAEVAIDVGAGVEEAVPATKTFTATLVAIALVAEAIGSPPWRPAELGALPGLVEQELDDPGPVRRVGQELDGCDRLLVTARGPLLAAALETALKVRETCAIAAEGMSSADLRHGPIAAITEGHPVVAIAGDRSRADIDELAALLRRRGAAVHVMSADAGAAVSLPPGVPETLLPVLAAVRGQQLAAAMAARRGRDPDAPAGLTKVTMTR